jgi:predicted MFS family arabinose efflux permease
VAHLSECRPLRQRPILALLTAEVISAVGSQMTFLALPWFVLQTTGSPTRMGVVLAVQLAPIAILGIPSGTVVSKWGARRTMLVSDLARAPLLASIPLLHALGWLTFPLLLALVALIGVFLAPYFASQRLILPELVGDDEPTVAKANAVVEGAQRATSLLGPAAAGVLIATFSAPTVLYVDAATFLCSFALLSLFVPTRPPLAPSGEAGGVLAGVRFVLADRVLRVLGGSALITNGLGQMLSAGLTVLAFEEYGSSRVAGAFFAAFGAGAVLGSIAAVRIVGRFDPLRLGATAFVALTLPIFVLGFELPVPVVMVALAASSFFSPLVNAPLIGVITMRTPEALRAKVMTAVITTAMLAGPLGVATAGPLLESWGPRRVFLLVASGQVLATIPFALVAFGATRSAEPVPET